MRIDDAEEIELVRQLLAAHEYWRMKAFEADLVILNEKEASYNQDLQLAIEAAVRTRHGSAPAPQVGPQGMVYVLRADLIGAAAKALLLSVARVVLVSRRGRLVDQLDRLDERGVPPPAVPRAPRGDPAGELPALEFFNGTGGFATSGREYVIRLREGRTTPAPWMNVIANPRFGFHATADGGGYAWWHNSRENQITPWSNDPVADRPGDVVYLRDAESGALWSATAAPVRVADATYDIRHGMGWSRFATSIEGIASELLAFVPVEDTVKISRLTLRNTGTRVRRIAVTRYVEWVLGPARATAAAHVVTERDGRAGAVLARNPWHIEFGPCVAFLAMPGRDAAATGDRREFLGRNGTPARPAALLGEAPLSGRLGAGLDPCTALQAVVTLQPGETAQVVMLLGTAPTAEEAVALAAAYAAPEAVDAAFAAVAAQWEGVLGGIEVRTPDRALDLMLNGWLLYQTLACRVWARSGFYQASGAFGFRDQLQDGMALVLSRPDLTRAHLLRAAGRQFREGDVQHWWLPPGGQGVRTRISDDRAWLAQAVTRYMTVTGDAAVLDEEIAFLDGQALGAHEHEAYFRPTESATRATLFEHCALALDDSLATGPHGLPLMGTGDWNDGMSRVGEGGTGESVWLGWFLHDALRGFAPFAEARGDRARAAAWRDHAEALRVALERDGWDGRWYRRAYFDDGTPLGSAASSECRIDAIAQSWAVISGAAQPARMTQAMAAVDEQLIRRHDRLALLFTPPFNHTPLDPGYIKGYPPGLRENGGQYTHAAAWTAIALAMLGEGDRAAELLAMINPINHAATAADSHRYKVEPYVVAADVYAAPGHIGRGGWTWYTGSAGWLYRAGLEALLGFNREGNIIRMAPCIPRAWPGFEIRLRNGNSSVLISVENGGSGRRIAQAWVDDDEVSPMPLRFALPDDGHAHKVRIVLT